MKILIINGPNLNMLGIREVNIYGSETYEELKSKISDYCDSANIDMKIVQSNSEGKLVDYVQSAYFDEYDGVVINPAAYTLTSVALLDAIKAIAPIPVIECHLSDVNNREEFRKISFVTSACVGVVSGLGINSYIKAIDDLSKIIIGNR